MKISKFPRFFVILIFKTMKISKFPRFFGILITKIMKISKFPRFFWYFDHQNHENIKIS